MSDCDMPAIIWRAELCRDVPARRGYFFTLNRFERFARSTVRLWQLKLAVAESFLFNGNPPAHAIYGQIIF